ncbi:Uncharacterized protein BM_BM17167 [Brugia malayi]|uniref:Uncharacterized protein n=1 Tax=Brugia malayi TaxID=6279 RepID=A0A4E9FT69_BRUMA|nr:Uncharacterized protein BM_BM17167 [Brugia malayi]VIP00212.1 Uncharacterized protein BM_BM17167 [Brugia malayi]
MMIYCDIEMLKVKLLRHLMSTPMTLLQVCIYLVHNKMRFRSIFTNLLFPQTTHPVNMEMLNRTTWTISTSRIT